MENELPEARKCIYPTDKEIEFANAQLPELKRFTHQYKAAFAEFIKRVIPEKDKCKREIIEKQIVKENEFQSWNIILFNKLSNLKYSSSLSIFFYNELLDSSKDILLKPEQKAMFFFYSEISFYLIESVNDIIAQILNLLISTPYEEDRVSLTKIQKSNEINSEIRNYLKRYLIEIDEVKSIRNSLTHRYPDTMNDTRIRHSAKDGQNSFGFGLGSKVKPQSINPKIIQTMEEMKELLNFLDDQFQELFNSKSSGL